MIDPSLHETQRKFEKLSKKELIKRRKQLLKKEKQNQKEKEKQKLKNGNNSISHQTVNHQGRRNNEENVPEHSNSRLNGYRCEGKSKMETAKANRVLVVVSKEFVS